MPENVRSYLFSGTQHIPGGYLPSQGPGMQKPNGSEFGFSQRALLVAMDDWVKNNIPPPRSAIPRLADKTLVPAKRIAFPDVPGVHSPTTIEAGYRANLEQPDSHPLPLLVPQVDSDGNELAGIRLPNVAVPLATYTGWNFRDPLIGMADKLLPLTGSFIPFSRTKAEREQARDPRLSIEERYQSRSQYGMLVREAASKLVQERYLLTRDVPAVVDRALETWDQVMKPR